LLLERSCALRRFVSSKDSLLVFARYPTPGRVKTRIASRIGDAAAARLYDAFVRDLVGRLAGARFDVRWAVEPPDPGFAERFGVRAEACFEQRGLDLGARMHAAFVDHLEGAGAQDRCVLIGSDAPHLSVARIDEAFARLSSADVVLGPAPDGGYYLIAMRRPHDVFSGMTWSVDSVREETEKRAAAQGLAVALLDPEFDVDEWEDVQRLRRILENGDVRCPATSRVLAELAHR